MNTWGHFRGCRGRGQSCVYHSRKLFTASSSSSFKLLPLLFFTKMEGKMGQTVGEFGKSQKSSRVGIPNQTFLVSMSPNSLFYDLQDKNHNLKKIGKSCPSSRVWQDEKCKLSLKNRIFKKQGRHFQRVSTLRQNASYCSKSSE